MHRILARRRFASCRPQQSKRKDFESTAGRSRNHYVLANWDDDFITSRRRHCRGKKKASVTQKPEQISVRPMTEGDGNEEHPSPISSLPSPTLLLLSLDSGGDELINVYCRRWVQQWRRGCGTMILTLTFIGFIHGRWLENMRQEKAQSASDHLTWGEDKLT